MKPGKSGWRPGSRGNGCQRETRRSVLNSAGEDRSNAAGIQVGWSSPAEIAIETIFPGLCGAASLRADEARAVTSADLLRQPIGTRQNAACVTALASVLKRGDPTSKRDSKQQVTHR